MNNDFIKKAELSLKEKKTHLEQELSSFATKDPGLRGDWDTKYPRTPEGGLEEAAGEVEEYSTNLHIEFSLEVQLKNVNAALVQIEKGAYGICQDCKTEILKERILAIPESQYCTTCTKKQ